MNKATRISLLFGLLLTLVGGSLVVQRLGAIDAVASIGHLAGNVDVLRESNKIPARKGLILNDQDVVVTGRFAKATIIFRDGSEIRLFPSTRFVIEKSKESTSGSRRFFHDFKLQLGSFWGRFTKGRQNTKVQTPTATIGIKGTNLMLTQSGGKLDVALSAGSISVANEDQTIELGPGKMIKGVTQSGQFDDKVSDMPYRLQILPDHMKLNLPPEGRTTEVHFTLQLIDTVTGQNVDRTGTVYMSLDNDKIQFPEQVELNKRGYARVKAVIQPFQKADYRDGQVEVYAVMDDQKDMDVGSGQTILNYDVPKQMGRTIRLDVNTGNLAQ